MNEYKSRIHEYFSHKRGQGLILSPKNWMVIEKWEKMGIPLHIVVHGLDKTFENLSSGDRQRKKIHQLAYFEPEILKLWKEYRKKRHDTSNAQTIEVEQGTEEQKRIREYVVIKISGFLTHLAGKIKKDDNNHEVIEALHKIRLEEKLKILCREVRESLHIKIEMIEKQLQKLDKELLESLLSCLPLHKVKNLRLAAEEEIKGYKDMMESAAYQETVEAHFTELLRKEFGIQRLSLYL